MIFEFATTRFQHVLAMAGRYTEADGNLQEETFASKARLILHFDVNKTIIMTDKAQASRSPVAFCLPECSNLQVSEAALAQQYELRG